MDADAKFFSNEEIINNMLDVVRKKYDITKESFGDFAPEVIYIYDFEKTSDYGFKLIKEFYEVNNRSIYNGVYVTSYNKTNNKALNDNILKKEISILKPERVINISDFKIHGSTVFTLNPCDLKKVSLFKYEKTKEDGFEDSKKNVVAAIKYGILGG